MEENRLYADLLATAVRAAEAGAEVLRHYFRGPELEVRAKGAHDYVTRADHESEERVIAEVRRDFPDHGILAEESGQRCGDETLDSEFEWLIDPLDGTNNFLHGLPVFCVSIGCRHRDRMVAAAILDPLGRNLFTASHGGGAFWNRRPARVAPGSSLDGAFLATGYPFRTRQALDLYLDIFRAMYLQAGSIRRCGAAALDLAYTAAGVYDGFFEFRLSPWDIAAGSLVVREAGGQITDLDGGSGFLASGNVIAGGPAIHAELLATVRRYADEATLDALDPPRRVPGPGASARNNLLQTVVE